VKRGRTLWILLLGGAELLLTGRPRVAPTRRRLYACKSAGVEKEWG
jgi:hypothetical protein